LESKKERKFLSERSLILTISFFLGRWDFLFRKVIELAAERERERERDDDRNTPVGLIISAIHVSIRMKKKERKKQSKS